MTGGSSRGKHWEDATCAEVVRSISHLPPGSLSFSFSYINNINHNTIEFPFLYLKSDKNL
jgi:hypothetical protein